jgi:hypothetical protein
MASSSCYFPDLTYPAAETTAEGDGEGLSQELLPLLGGSCSLDASCVKFGLDSDCDHLMVFGDMLMPLVQDTDLLGY